MSAWTVRQEDVLRAYGHLGVAEVAKRLAAECGVRRSQAAIAMHASRIRVSLAERQVCPECRAVGVHLNRVTGLCPTCTMRAHVEEERAFNELLLAEAEGRDSGEEYEALEREWQRLRQVNSRLRRRNGLRGKGERG